MRSKILFFSLLLALAPLLPAEDGVVRPAGQKWPFKDGDRLYWFGASHTSIGIYCSTVEFYARTRFPELKLVSAHTSKPTGLNAGSLKGVIEERKPTIVFPEGGFYDTHDPVKFVQGAAAVASVCSNAGARCIFLPTMWIGNTLKKAPPEFSEKDINIEEVTKKLVEAKKITGWEMTTPAEITPPYFRCKKGLALDKTMAAEKEWGDKNGVLVLGTYDDQANWAKAQWAKNPDFVFLEGSSPHPIQSGYMVVGIYALEHLEAPIFESRLEIDAADGKAAVGKAVNCEASDAAQTAGTISFKRVDRKLPVIPPAPVWAIPGEPAPVLKQSPYIIKVTGLPAGSYTISVEGAAFGTASAEELAAGVNVNEVYLKSGSKRAPKFPWLKLWEACRGSTMDKDYAPAENEVIGKSAWKWEIKPAK